jgi:nickel/cobalt transporter (NiCoT) family protein
MKENNFLIQDSGSCIGVRTPQAVRQKVGLMLPTEWFPLCGTVLPLGVRHGLDADHLAAIDGLTRYNSESRPRLAPWCGVLFALGHGVVVLLVAGIVGSATLAYHVPDWLEGVGAWISIAFLLALGLLNLRAVLSTPTHEMVRLSEVRARILLRLTQTCRPLGIAAIGSLFAISFDTLSQAVLFSTAAARVGGAAGAIGLGAVFALGMTFVDGLNSSWVAGLLKARDRRARLVSRAIGWLVATLSFTVAILGALRYFNPTVDTVVAAYEVPIGIALVLTVFGAIVLIGRFVRRAELRIPT